MFRNVLNWYDTFEMKNLLQNQNPSKIYDHWGVIEIIIMFRLVKPLNQH